MKIIYNNLGEQHGYIPAWGFSAMIIDDGEHILFDTGGDPDVFGNNLKAAGFTPGQIDHIVFSHNHWDHTGGFSAIAGSLKEECKFYLPASDAGKFPSMPVGHEVLLVKDPKQITAHVWAGGELYAEGRQLFEQALVINMEDKIYIVTGCSHPGIDMIVGKAGKDFNYKPIGLVTGGFHLHGYSEKKLIQISNGLKKNQVEIISPSHCTGDKSIAWFENQWNDQFRKLYLGAVFSFA